MRKTFQLQVEGKQPDRVLDAVKHEIRKYIKRERWRELPAGADFWDFDCGFGLARDTAAPSHLGNLIAQIDEAAKSGANSFYVELLAKPGKRKPRDPGQAPEPDILDA